MEEQTDFGRALEYFSNTDLEVCSDDQPDIQNEVSERVIITKLP